MFQECEYEISQKGELVAKLENKTREISLMLNNLNKITATPEKKRVKPKQDKSDDKASNQDNQDTANQQNEPKNQDNEPKNEDDANKVQDEVVTIIVDEPSK